jgi:DNA-binding transcriptional regulator YiaG
MPSSEFNAALKSLALTVATAANLLDVDERTIKRWKYDERTVPGPVASFLRHLLKKKPRP